MIERRNEVRDRRRNPTLPLHLEEIDEKKSKVRLRDMI
jgi:hypothetical protein